MRIPNITLWQAIRLKRIFILHTTKHRNTIFLHENNERICMKRLEKLFNNLQVTLIPYWSHFVHQSHNFIH